MARRGWIRLAPGAESRSSAPGRLTPVLLCWPLIPHSFATRFSLYDDQSWAAAGWALRSFAPSPYQLASYPILPFVFGSECVGLSWPSPICRKLDLFIRLFIYLLNWRRTLLHERVGLCPPVTLRLGEKGDVERLVSILRFLFHFPVWPILSLVKVEAQEVWSWWAGASGDRSHPSPYSASGAVRCSSSRSLLSCCAALLTAHMEPPALTLWVVWLHRLELHARCLLQLVRFHCGSCFLKVNPLC